MDDPRRVRLGQRIGHLKGVVRRLESKKSSIAGCGYLTKPLFTDLEGSGGALARAFQLNSLYREPDCKELLRSAVSSR